MSRVRSNTLREERPVSRPVRRSAEARQRRQKVLVAVDGSERTGRVLEYLIGMAASGIPMEVVVLNVQPAPEDWRLRGYASFKQDEVHGRLLDELGRPIVASVGRTLAQAGIAHKERVELGVPAETILRCAKEEGCELIVMSGDRLGAFRTWLTTATGLILGSVATKVAQLSEMPVVIVK
jgi:nucleotide-binding universal stress UspA family protein